MEDDSEKGGLANGGRESSSQVPSSPGEKAPCLPPASPDHLRHHSEERDSVDVKRSGFVSRLQRSASKRTGLSPKGLLIVLFIILLCFFLFIAVVAMAASWPVTPHAFSAPVCRTASCLKASAQVVSAMSMETDPCDDLVTFSCGSWLRNNPIPPSRSRWSQTEQIKAKYNELVRSLIVKKQQPTQIVSIPWKMKNLYESCMELDNIEADSERPLIRIINELGGWQVLRDFSVQSFDYKKTLLKLHSNHGVSPFFKVMVVPDDRNPEKNIIQISPTELGLPHPSYYYRLPENAVAMAYQQFLMDVVQLLGAMSTDARSFARTMYHFEKRIAELLLESEQPSNPIEAYNRITIEKLRQTAASIPLQDILQALFAEARITDKTEVIVTSPSYLNKISELLSTTDRSSLNNYMMWRFAIVYLPFLSSAYRAVLNNYNVQLKGVQGPVERWEMCVETVDKFMGFAVAAMVEEAYQKERENDAAEISSMFDNIRSAVRNRLLQASWYDPDLKKNALKKVNAVALAVGFPSSLTSTNALEDYYSHLHVMKKDFFVNVRYGIEFLLWKQRQQLISPSEEQRWLDVMAAGVDVTYIPTANKVVVPQRRLLEPYFSAYYPKSVLYSRLGVQLSHAIVYGVSSLWGGLHTDSGALPFAYSPEVEQALRRAEKVNACLTAASERDANIDREIANRTAAATAVEISAARLALLALGLSILKEPHVHQPALEVYENEQLFFVTYAQSLCSHTTAQQADIDSTVSKTLNSTYLIPVLLKQLSEFSTVFSCSVNSVHYASRPCSEVL